MLSKKQLLDAVISDKEYCERALNQVQKDFCLTSRQRTRMAEIRRTDLKYFYSIYEMYLERDFK